MSLFENPAEVYGFKPRATYALLIGTTVATVLIWLIQMVFHLDLSILFGLSLPGLLHGWVWQVVSYLFLHGGTWHLLANMLGLFFVGPELERSLGRNRFLGAYFLCGILAGLGWILLSYLGWIFFAGFKFAACIGASGALFGLLGIFGGLYPTRQVTLLVFFILPVTLKARNLVFVLMAVSVIFLIKDSGNVAHAAHLAGGVAGYLYGRRRRLDLDSDYAVVSPPAHSRSLLQRLQFWKRPHLKIHRIEPGIAPEEIDAVLDKINRFGYASLNRTEMDILDRASREMRNRR
jgi:membrane associated rhomboid family serine protease